LESPKPEIVPASKTTSGLNITDVELLAGFEEEGGRSLQDIIKDLEGAE
jgi:hypothetical protein